MFSCFFFEIYVYIEDMYIVWQLDSLGRYHPVGGTNNRVSFCFVLCELSSITKIS